jgi:hypothetical protein
MLVKGGAIELRARGSGEQRGREDDGREKRGFHAPVIA